MIVLLLPLASAGDDAAGFAEVRLAAYAGADGTPWQLVTRARPSFERDLGERVRIATTIEAALAQGRDNQQIVASALADSDVGPLLDLAGCTWPENDNEWFDVDGADDYLHVDRLFVDVYQPGFDLRVGRQALQWGSALFVNPTDPYPQVLFTEPWRPRAGVNAARLTVPIGDRHQIQAVAGLDDDFQQVRAAARATANWKETDWSVLAAVRPESDELLTGVDIKGTAGVGFWVEGALHWQGLTEPDADLVVKGDLAVGVDYSFPLLETLYVAGQYVRAQGSDRTAAASLGAIQGPECDQPTPFDTDTEPDPFAPFFSGTDYGLLVANLAITRDVTVSNAWLQNLGDGSAVLIPSATVRPTGRIDVSLTGQIPAQLWGDGGEFHPNDADLVLTVPDTDLSVDLSGLVPDATVFLWTRYSF
jgi:hypothetical protein